MTGSAPASTPTRRCEISATAPAPDLDQALVEVEDLTVSFRTPQGRLPAVQEVSWSVRPGETLVLLGESGSGKSVSANAVAGLLPDSATVTGTVRFQGDDLLALDAAGYRRFRADHVGMVFQDPLTSLDPCFPVGDQLAEVFRVHERLGRREAWRRAVELLRLVQIGDPERRVRQYPHELSGGMRQRVVIALAISRRPRLLIADEPTTALDPSVQLSVLGTIQDLRDRLGMAVVMITHDIGVAAAVADRVGVMYAGRIVEDGPAREVLQAPHHPYTAALLASRPRASSGNTQALQAISGTPPSLATRPPGCAFHPRCTFAADRCQTELPRLRPAGGQRTACHFAEDLAPRLAAQAARGDGGEEPR